MPLAEDLGVELERTLLERQRLGRAAQRFQGKGEVVEGADRVGMPLAEDFGTKLERPLEERQRLGGAAQRVQGIGEVVEGAERVGMPHAERLERLLVSFLRLNQGRREITRI